VIGGLGIEIEGGIVVPALRHQFIFKTPETPQIDVYHVPSVAGSGALGVSMRFP
jgi:hypothetical protein